MTTFRQNSKFSEPLDRQKVGGVLWNSGCRSSFPFLPSVCVCVCVCVCGVCLHACAHTQAQSCPILFNPMDFNLAGSSVNGISQAGTLKWVTISSSRGSLQLRGWTSIYFVSCIGRQFLAKCTNWQAISQVYSILKGFLRGWTLAQ